MRQQIKQKLSEILDKVQKEREQEKKLTKIEQVFNNQSIVIDCDQFITCRFCQALTVVTQLCDRCGRRQ